MKVFRYLTSCMCSVVPSNRVNQVLNGFQKIACNFCFLEQPDSLTRNLRKLFHKYYFSFRTNISWISAAKNKRRTLSFNCCNLLLVIWNVERDNMVYIFYLYQSQLLGQKLLIYLAEFYHQHIKKTKIPQLYPVGEKKKSNFLLISIIYNSTDFNSCFTN